MIIKQKQLEFLDWELGVFFHFGIRTFYEGHVEWDMKPMPAEKFNPVNLDTDQWIKTVKDGGGKYAVLVTKHHDGFANWPSKYTDYSVKNTPWRDGKGDVVKEFVNSCRKFDIKIGLYYSPAEFGSVDRTSLEDNHYFIDQITELLTGYGKIDYLWFDGCGSQGHDFDKVRIIKAIRTLQPDILIFGMWDPDTRWIGNEEGYAGLDDTLTAKKLKLSIDTDIEDALPQDVFLPCECDLRIRKRNWFYSDLDAHTLKSAEELFGIYLVSVGRSANMLVNITPNREGLLPVEDSSRFIEFGNLLRQRFSNPFATVDNPSAKESNNVFSIEGLDNQKNINYLVIEEDISDGDKIRCFEVYLYPRSYSPKKLFYCGKTVGHKAIIPIYGLAPWGVEIKITSSLTDNFKIKRISLC